MFCGVVVFSESGTLACDVFVALYSAEPGEICLCWALRFGMCKRTGNVLALAGRVFHVIYPITGHLRQSVCHVTTTDLVCACRVFVRACA